MFENKEEEILALKQCIEKQNIKQLGHIIDSLDENETVLVIKHYGLFREDELDDGMKIVSHDIKEIPDNVLDEWRISGIDKNDMMITFERR